MNPLQKLQKICELTGRCAVALLLSSVWSSGANGASSPAGPERGPIVIIKDGVARMPIIAGSQPVAARELRDHLKRMSGADLEIAEARPGVRGIYVGLSSDFPWMPAPGCQQLGPEGFVMRSDGTNLVLLACDEDGVQHAVASFLQTLGCRWFFPGRHWEVIPAHRTVQGSWNERSAPDFALQRKIWHGFGSYRPVAEDFAAWERHNRLGGSVKVSIGHTWHGLNPEKDFATHPEWFALVSGQRKNSKPCYSHPEVIQRGIADALRQAGQGVAMISMSPPDGLGYCECERCLSVSQGVAPYLEHGTWFVRRTDGAIVNVTSENLFRFVNEVARAVTAKHPRTLIGCYAYSAYSHPPSFALHPNVFLQTTTAFRRTSLTLEQQLEVLRARTAQIGIREYYSVYQWDWDYPHVDKLQPARLQKDLRFFREHKVTSVNAEASNNWGARGLGYYLAAQWLWDADADRKTLLRDFYQRAFGPAAGAMERYYVRWYGPSAAVTEALPAASPSPAESGRADVHGPKDEISQEDTGAQFNLDHLLASYRDLDEAARLLNGHPEYKARVDDLRLYWHYLFLRRQLDLAAEKKDADAILKSIRNELIFGGRITYSHMIHSRPLLGKALLRRFKPFEKLLANAPEVQKEGQGWRVIGPPPSGDELERLWAEDKDALGMRR